MKRSNIYLKDYDVAIVGAGLAGCILGDRLTKAGYSVIVFDQVAPGEASKVSSGLINPVTGLRFVKTWRFDELLENAMVYYKDLEIKYDQKIVHPLEILVFLKEIEAENNWLARTEDPLYSSFICLEPSPEYFSDQLQLPLSLGKIRNAYRIDIPKVVRSLKIDLKNRCEWLEAQFDYSGLKLSGDSWSYSDCYEFKKIVFCEGYKIVENPFFNWLPIHGLKGEFLKVTIPVEMPAEVLQSDYTVIPMGHQNFWVGANYELKNITESTTKEERSKQEAFLDQTIKSAYHVQEHNYGIRASSRDRRPAVGRHPQLQNLYVINGLGTKGVTLAPFCTNHLLSLFSEGVELPSEIDIKRFVKKGFYRMNESFDRSI
ncbi:MAG: FAD-binding oxidoreductase [Saprospiraceae bacterium]|nr:FAD-binding oxidoreductase [Candidatus Vicinibacter affinis]